SLTSLCAFPQPHVIALCEPSDHGISGYGNSTSTARASPSSEHAHGPFLRHGLLDVSSLWLAKSATSESVHMESPMHKPPVQTLGPSHRPPRRRAAWQSHAALDTRARLSRTGGTDWFV